MPSTSTHTAARAPSVPFTMHTRLHLAVGTLSAHPRIVFSEANGEPCDPGSPRNDRSANSSTNRMRSCAARLLVVLLAAFAMFSQIVATANAQPVAWTQPYVSRRASHAMAYDSARCVTVLFGGNNLASANLGLSLGETWEWNGTTWTQRIVSGPSVRDSHAMAYDSARGVTVLFGGNNTNPAGSNAETWEWNGTTWTQRMVSGPSARYGHAMVYDSLRGVTVLFGGYTTANNGETWEWNGTVWTRIAVVTPQPRAYHSMAYDSARGVTVMFGGMNNYANGDINSETWEWNGTEWTFRGVGGPPRRFKHAMVHDARRGRTVLFSGFFSGAAYGGADTWEWDGTQWTQRATSGPSPRYSHAMTYDMARDVTVLFGGNKGTIDADAETWEWNGTAWIQRVRGSPPGTHSHAMAYDSDRAVTVLFGGAIPGFNLNTVTFEWNGTTWTQRAISGPSGRANHAMAYDSARRVTVMFGGVIGGGFSYGASTWEWNGTAWTDRLVSGPSGRASHAMAYDSRRGVTVLFGGFNLNNTRDAETWEWDGTVWSRRNSNGPSPSPSPRSGHMMAYDAARGVCVLFGGSTATNVYDSETWEWDGTVWTRRLVSGPSPRASAAMAYDPARNVSVLFGGLTGTNTYNAETWEWNGTEWTRRIGFSPSPRGSHAMVYDTARASTVLFGGHDTQGGIAVSNAETWNLRAPCVTPGTTQPSDQTTCQAETATFAVTATGTAPFTWRWQWQPTGAGTAWVDLAEGENAAPGGAAVISASNVHTSTLGIRPLTASTNLTRAFRCMVSSACGNIISSPASLTVEPCRGCSPADIAGGHPPGPNYDGIVDGSDFIAFFNSFSTGDPTLDRLADIAGAGPDNDQPDGTIDGTDFIAFMNAFAAGC